MCSIFVYNIVSHNFRFPFSFQDITLVFLIMFNYANTFQLWNLFINSNKRSDILKTNRKLKILRDYSLDSHVMYIMTIRFINFVQSFLRNIIFRYFHSIHNFHIFSFPNKSKMLSSLDSTLITITNVSTPSFIYLYNSFSTEANEHAICI